MGIFAMPRLGESVTEGKVIRWLKQQGETVDQDELIVEVATDKVDTEIPSPLTGRIDKILVTDGETCAVGTGLAEIITETEIGTTGKASAGVEAEAETKTVAEAESSTDEGAAEAGSTTERQDEPDGTRATGAMVPAKDRAAKMSPIVRKLARENNIDLRHVAGTGRHGRISKKDIQGVLAQRSAGQAPQVPPQTNPREEVVPLTRMRRIIAQRMVAGQQTAATVTAMIDVDMEKIVEMRRAHKDEIKKREGVVLTYLPFVCRAVIEALEKWPTLNATLRDDDIIIKKYINLGIAVSVPGGLLVPVIKDAQDLNILGLARAIAAMAERARAGRLEPDDIHDGSFTITNPGSFGSTMQTPIINPPEVAIVSFDAIVRRPVALGDAIAVHHVGNLGLSYDHRVNDGAIAAQFLGAVKKSLESVDYGEELLK